MACVDGGVRENGIEQLGEQRAMRFDEPGVDARAVELAPVDAGPRVCGEPVEDYERAWPCIGVVERGERGERASRQPCAQQWKTANCRIGERLESLGCVRAPDQPQCIFFRGNACADRIRRARSPLPGPACPRRSA